MNAPSRSVLLFFLPTTEPSLSRACHKVVCRPLGAQLSRPAQIEPSTFLPITAKARGTTPQHTAGRRSNNDICLESSRIPPSPAYRLPGQASLGCITAAKARSSSAWNRQGTVTWEKSAFPRSSQNYQLSQQVAEGAETNGKGMAGSPSACWLAADWGGTEVGVGYRGRGRGVGGQNGRGRVSAAPVCPLSGQTSGHRYLSPAPLGGLGTRTHPSPRQDRPTDPLLPPPPPPS